MSDLNKCIFLVMKWLDDKDSVSKDELLENRRSAYTAYTVAAAGGAAAGSTYDAEKWVNKYFERTGENEQDYIYAIEAGKKPQEPESKEWVDGLPPVGCECLTVHKGYLVECLYVGKGLGKEYIYQVSSGSHRGEIDRLIGAPRFRPLKTEKEKEREAFIDRARPLFDGSLGWAELTAKMFDDGFKAPEGE